MKRSYVIAIVATGIVSVAFFALLIVLAVKAFDSEDFGADGEAVAVIRLEGVISGTDDDGGLTGGGGIISPEGVITQLDQALEDDSVSAILLRINSPGGTAAASEEIYREVRRANKKKPVVVSISDLGASGGYYIASAASKIVASPASEVGSIGVIIQVPNLKGLFEKLGIDLQVIAQGKYKDLGNPGRAITPEERKILSDQSEVVYDRFISDVAKGRKMKEADIRKLANGLTYPGIEAKKLGLVDKLGNYRDGLALAADLGGIEGDPEIVDYEEDSFEELFGSLFASGLTQDKLMKLLGNEAFAPVFK